MTPNDNAALYFAVVCCAAVMTGLIALLLIYKVCS